MTLATYGTQIDLGPIAPRERAALVFNTFRLLEAGQTMELVAGEDLQPLQQPLLDRVPGRFGWEVVENGPQRWRVRVLRIRGGCGGGGGCCCA